MEIRCLHAQPQPLIPKSKQYNKLCALSYGEEQAWKEG
jgi:hypothetical protein